MNLCVYTEWPRKVVIINTITKDRTTSQMCRYITLCNVNVLKLQMKKDFCNNKC